MRNRIPKHNNNKRTHHLIGVGLDNHDGHKRVTNAEKFTILGGSEETHERITSTLIKTFEDLDRKGKSLEQTESRELADIIAKNAASL